MPTKKSSSDPAAANHDNVPATDLGNVASVLYSMVEDEKPAIAPAPTPPPQSVQLPQAAPPPTAQVAPTAGKASGGIDPFTKAFLCGGAFVLGTAVFGPIGGKIAAVLTGVVLGGGHHPNGGDSAEGAFS